MKRLLAACLIVFMVGCGAKAPPESGELSKATLPDSETGDLQVAQPTNPPGAGDPESGAANSLQQLVLVAQEFESQQQFQQAAETWSQIVEKLSQQFGPDCWQSANAKLACQTAMAQHAFTPAQRQALESITESQRQMSLAAGQNELRIATGLALQSVNQATNLFGAHSAVTAKQRIQYAKLLKATSQPADAAFQFEQSLTDLKQNFASSHPDICNIHDHLGDLYLGASNYPGAINHLKAATKMAAEIWGDDSLQYATRANQLGVSYYESGKPNISLQILRAAEVIRRNKLGANDIQVGHSLLNMGTVLVELRQLPDAIVQLKRAREIFSTNEELAGIHDQASEKLATAYMLNEQPDFAEPLLAYRLERAQKLLPETHPDVAELQYQYAVALARQGKYDQAEPAFRLAITANEKNFGPRHSSTIKSYRAFALVLQRTNRQEMAQKVLEQLRVAQTPDNNRFQR